VTEKFFLDFPFTREQVLKNLANARKSLAIARKDEILDVKFTYAYAALIKAGLALLSARGLKVRSMPGHHMQIIARLAEMLGDPAIDDLGNAMRARRNVDLYAGGTDITEKECAEYLEFVSGVVQKAAETIEAAGK